MTSPKKNLQPLNVWQNPQDEQSQKSNLMNYVYGVGEDVNETTLEVLVSRLRKKLSKHNIQINMARGLGYFLKAGK